MTAVATSQPEIRVGSQTGAPREFSRDGWLVREYSVVNSTNLTAAGMAPWSAVRADTQTAGRGRFQRSWISDQGGLWLSAVIPVGNTPQWRALPLAVGLAVCDTLRALGVKDLRMRWPNDILASDRKLAGLLIDQFTPGTAVAGIGLNVSNCPELLDLTLKQQTARLADLVATAPAIEDLTYLILRNLRSVIDQIHSLGFSTLLGRINALWGKPRPVQLELETGLRCGLFTGVDENGCLILQDESRSVSFHEASQVRHLKEI